jgi:hypothetical protein
METIIRIAMDKDESTQLSDFIHLALQVEHCNGGTVTLPPRALASVRIRKTRLIGHGRFRNWCFEGVSDSICLDVDMTEHDGWAKKAFRRVAEVLRLRATRPKWWTKEQYLVIEDSRMSPTDKAWVASTILATAPRCVHRAIAECASASPEAIVDLLLTSCRIGILLDGDVEDEHVAGVHATIRQLGLLGLYDAPDHRVVMKLTMAPTASTLHAMAFLAFNPRRVAARTIARAWRRFLVARRGVDALSGCLGRLGCLGEFAQVLYRHVLPVMLR